MTRLGGRADPGGDQSETTLRRGISILFTLGSPEAVEQGGLGVVQVAELLGREKSQVSRTLKTLEACGVVDRDRATLAYRLSWQLSTLAARGGDQRLLRLAAPVVAGLVERVNESAYLSVLQGRHVLTVLARPSRRLVQAVEEEGQLAPAHSTSAGRALLLDWTPEELRVLFGGESFERTASRTPRDVDDLLSRLDSDREQAHVVVEDELEDGLAAVAVPVRAQGEVVAALNVSGPTARLRKAYAAVTPELHAAAERLSAALSS